MKREHFKTICRSICHNISFEDKNGATIAGENFIRLNKDGSVYDFSSGFCMPDTDKPIQICIDREDKLYRKMTQEEWLIWRLKR